MPTRELPTTRSLDEMQATVLGRGRTLRRRRRRVGRTVQGAVVALPVLGILAAWSLAGSDDDRTARVIAATPESGREYEGDGLVLEQGDTGPQLCLGGINASDPPSCSGFPIADWQWDAVPGRNTKGRTTWASVHVRGRYEQGRFILTAAPTAPHPVDVPSTPDLSPACRNPEVVAPAQGVAEWEEATQRFGKLPGLVASWVSDAAAEGRPFVANVIVRPGSSDEARAAVRREYAGPLCVVERDLPTADELEAVHAGVLRLLGSELLMGSADHRRGVVSVSVVVVTPELQRLMDDEFGKGRVELHGRLRPVEP